PRDRSLQKMHAPHEVRNLVRWSSVFQRTAWQDVQITRKTDAAEQWRIKSAQVHLPRGHGSGRKPTDRTYWLIWAWNPATHESKCFISNAPPTTPVERILRVAFSRARIEHLFRISKSELGMSHFEGRSY